MKVLAKSTSVIRIAMNKLLLRDSPLMTKLLLFSGILVVVPLLLAGLILYRESSQVLEREAKYFSWQIIDQIKMSIESYVRDFELNTLKILNHPDTLSYLQEYSTNSTPNSELEKLVGNVLKNYAYSRSDVVNITIMLDGIDSISSSEESDGGLPNAIDVEEWYPSVPLMGKPTVMGRVIDWQGKQMPVISIMKRIAHPKTLKPFGMLVIDLNYKRLHDVVQNVRIGETGQGYVFILDQEGRYIYHLDEKLIGTYATSELANALQGDGSGSAVLTEEGKKLLTYSSSESLHWTVATSIRYKDLLRSTDYIGRTILLTSFIFVVIAYVACIGFAASIVKPIKRLYGYMKRVELGKLNERVQVESHDEVGLLTEGFNKMVKRLSELLEEIYVSKLRETKLELRQKETELQMLQSQINPHFLYNALENIRGMALEHDMDDIAAMSSSLAQLLRYNVKGNSTYVTVKQEIEIIELYLRIQAYRFGEKLTYRFDIPQWALSCRIAKFTLQPLVENSIVHAVEQRIDETIIQIKALKMDDASFAIMISDTGPGIHESKRQELIAGLEQMEEEGQGTHIGLQNVHRRIRHFFGAPYGLFVERAVHGMTVGIRLPLEDEDGTKGGGGNVSDTAG